MVCSETVQLLAFFGVIFLYGIVGVVFSLLVNELMKGSDGRQSDKETVVILAGIFWPVTIVALLVWIIAKVINNLLFGATIFDLRRTEGTLRQEIREVSASCAPCNSLAYSSDGYEAQLDIWNVEEQAPIAQPFKVGDLVTGRVPQTDKDGNIISYEHLYTGCKCRVLSIDDRGVMSLLLLAHKDGVAHKEEIGKTFNAPARNFVPLKGRKKAKKRVVKKYKNKKKGRR